MYAGQARHLTYDVFGKFRVANPKIHSRFGLGHKFTVAACNKNYKYHAFIYRCCLVDAAPLASKMVRQSFLIFRYIEGCNSFDAPYH